MTRVPPPDPFLTTAQLAKRFGVTTSTIARWFRQGKIRGSMPYHAYGRFGGWRARESEVTRLAKVAIKAAGRKAR